MFMESNNEKLRNRGFIQQEDLQNIIYLAKIGKNQYKELPSEPSRKKSYPLPRDIIARTLAKMDTSIMPFLMKVLKEDDLSKISEVIDAINDENNILYKEAERSINIINSKVDNRK